METQDPEVVRLTKVLDHPVRARIIELLGDRGPLGWKELSQDLGVKTGALYYHLDSLEGLVTRDSSRKYALSKSGMVVYSRIAGARTIDSLNRAALDLREAGRWRRAVVSFFAPRALLTSFTGGTGRALSILLGLGILYVTIAIFFTTSPSLYFFQRVGSPNLAVAGLAASLAVLMGVCFATAILAKSEADPVLLATTSAFSFLPVVAFSAFANLPWTSSLFTSYRVVYTICLVFFQTWSATFLGAGISVVAGIRIEKSLLVSLIVLYATMVFVFVQGKAV